ncbi:MAG: WYL domain-containing protein [Anaerolineae bacterium]|nr:WYL domain-containing protein [Anaerolineae bacterium]
MTGTIDLAGAEAAAGQTLDALRQAIEGRAAFPPWPEHGLPEETSRQTIEQALAAGHHLHLTYYAASTNRLTDRLVEPYRLEWRGDTPYLIAFCHHAQSERMFRLDRIREVEPIATE